MGLMDTNALQNAFNEIEQIVKDNGDLGNTIQACIDRFPPDTSFNVDFLKQKFRGSISSQKTVIKILPFVEDSRSIEILLDALNQDDPGLVASALEQLSGKTIEKIPPKIFELLDDKRSNWIRLNAMNLLVRIGDNNAFYHLTKRLADTEGIIVLEAKRYLLKQSAPPPTSENLWAIYQLLWFDQNLPSEMIRFWANEINMPMPKKLEGLADFVASSFVFRKTTDPRIIYAIAFKSTEQAVAETLVDLISLRDFDARQISIFALFLSTLFGGEGAGDKPAIEFVKTKLAGVKGADTDKISKRLNALMLAIASGQQEVLDQLQSNLQAFYVKAADELIDQTMSEWKTTVAQAKLGFTTRLWMNIIMFGLGVVITVASLILLFVNNSAGLTAMVGSGISLIAGIATMSATLFFGPLREIARSVADVGVLNTSMIGYIHRVLQISHTFQYLYLTQKIDLQQLTSTTDLVEKATQFTTSNLLDLIERQKKELPLPRDSSK